MSAIVQFATQYPVAIVATVAIGVVAVLSLLRGPVGAKPKKARAALDDKTFQSFLLTEKIVVSPDTRIFRFKLPNPDDRLGLPIGQHMYLKATIGGDEVQRAYTPITSDDDLGYFDLMIKVYFKGVHPKFPDGGKLTQYLEGLTPGKDSVLVRGPTGRFEYLGKGKYHTKVGVKGYGDVKRVKKIGMIAGGTGITPMLQVMRAALDDPTDKTQLSLLYANRDHNKILLQGLIDHLAEEHPDRLKVYYTIDKMPTDGSEWTGFVGHVDDAMVRATMPPPSKENLVMLCGPDPMMVHVGGCAMGNLNTMSGANPSQGAHAGLNNLGDIPPHCVFGRLGYIKEWVYRF